MVFMFMVSRWGNYNEVQSFPNTRKRLKACPKLSYGRLISLVYFFFKVMEI